MKFSKNTRSVLKNFSTINNGIEFKKGNILRTIDSDKTLLAEAQLDETLPRDFAIYDLQKFLSVETLLLDPDFNFADDAVTITDGVKKVRWRAADSSMITTPPSSNLNLPETRAGFELSEENFESVRKASALLSLPDLVFKTVNGNVVFQATDIKNPDSDTFEIDTGVTSDCDFSVIFKSASVVVLPGRYKIELTEQAGVFQNLNVNVKYWVAVDPSSKFN